MTIPTWPSDLPQLAALDNFTLSQAEGRIRSQTDTGPGKVRLLNSAAVTPFTVQVQPLTIDQYARFERFWNEEIGYGVLPFWLPDLFYDGLTLTDQDGNTITDQSGTPIVFGSWWLVRFGGTTPVKTPKSGFLVDHQFQIERLA